MHSVQILLHPAPNFLFWVGNGPAPPSSRHSPFERPGARTRARRARPAGRSVCRPARAPGLGGPSTLHCGLVEN